MNHRQSLEQKTPDDLQLSYKIHLDLTNSSLYVYMAYDIDEFEQVTSADGESTADVEFMPDGTPIVVGVEIRNQNKVTIFQDWIHDAIEAAMKELNVHRDERIEDNHWKGVLS
jgi:hypothetical protein